MVAVRAAERVAESRDGGPGQLAVFLCAHSPAMLTNASGSCRPYRLSDPEREFGAALGHLAL